MKNDEVAALKLGWSDFAHGRHVPGGKHTWYEGSPGELLDLVRAGWARRRPGAPRGVDGPDRSTPPRVAKGRRSPLWAVDVARLSRFAPRTVLQEL